MDDLDDPIREPEQPIRVMLARALKRARGSLLWERLWPALASLATAVGLFLAFSWAGLWLALPPLARAIGLFIFVVLTAIAALPLVRLRWPSVHDGLRRLDRGSGEAHRPASAIADEIASNENDPVTQALWRAHIERALMSARKLKAGWPQPKLALRDPMALRALVLILVVAGFFAGSGERVKRITAAFDWQGVVAPANFRVDAWVTPPLYTGRPPVMLPGLRPGETAQAAPPVAVPVGSQLVVRATGNVHFDVARKGGLEDRCARCAYRFAGGHRGAPLHHQGRRLSRAAWHRRHRSHLELHRHSRPSADDLAAQGSGAAGARRAAPRLQDGGRLRRRQRASDVCAQG